MVVKSVRNNSQFVVAVLGSDGFENEEEHSEFSL